MQSRPPLVALRNQKTLFMEVNLPAKAIGTDCLEMASTWADVGVRQNQGASPRHGFLYTIGPRTQRSAAMLYLVNFSFLQQ